MSWWHRIFPVHEARSPYRGASTSAPRAEFETIGPAILVDTIGSQLRLRSGEGLP